MKDHESALLKQRDEKHRKLYEENYRLHEEELRQAPVSDKILTYLTILAVIVIVLTPVCLVVSFVRLYILK